MEIHVPISKIDKPRQMAFGWANVFLVDGDAIVDSHAETIDTTEAIAAIEDAVYKYVLDSRSGDEQHVNYGVARLVESMVFTDEKIQAIAAHSAEIAGADDAVDRAVILRKIIPTAWWTGFKIDETDVWEKVDDGTYPMFSIVGTGKREQI